jgi:hypothetical protein
MELLLGALSNKTNRKDSLFMAIHEIPKGLALELAIVFLEA